MKKGKKSASKGAKSTAAPASTYVADDSSWKDFSGSGSDGDDDYISATGDARRDSRAVENTEIMALGASDAEDDALPHDSTRWDKIRAKQLADLDRKSKSWGATRDNYYDNDRASDYSGSEAEEVEKLEEKEAIKMQREQAAAIAEQDFGLADVLAAAKKKPSSAGAGKKGKKGVSAMGSEADAGSLTKDEKIRQVIADSPELIELLDEYTTRAKELRVDVQPLLAEARAAAAAAAAGGDQSAADALATKDGISFLELKHQLLTAYCVNLAFYLLLRTEGRAVANHPVVRRLVHIRVTLEKMRPVDKQLKYQVDKLIQAGAATATAAAKAAPKHKSAAGVAATATGELTSFKPALAAMAASMGVATGARGKKRAAAESALLRKTGAEDGDDFDETFADDDDGAAAAPVSKAARARLAPASASLSAGSALDAADRLSARAAAETARRARRAAGSRLVQELRSELSERPEEASATGMGAPARLDRFEKERREFEEEHYVRLTDTKETLKNKKKNERINAMDDFDDFADLTNIVHAESRARAEAEKNARALAQLRARPRASAYDDDGSDDNGDDFGGMDDEYDDADTAAYESAAANASAKASAKRAAAAAAAASRVVKDVDADLVDNGERRHVGKRIMENKGQMRYRKNEGGVRKVSRIRAEKADARAKSKVQRIRVPGAGGEYGGESRGIKAGLVRSHKLAK